MKTNTLLMAQIMRTIAGSFVVPVLFVISAAFAEEALQPHSQRYAGAPSDPQALSTAEHQEYIALVSDLQDQLNRNAQFLVQSSTGYQWLSDRMHLSVRIGGWLRTVEYVKGATVNLPLFLSHPPRIQTQLQIQLKNGKVVVDDVALTFPMRPSLQY